MLPHFTGFTLPTIFNLLQNRSLSIPDCFITFNYFFNKAMCLKSVRRISGNKELGGKGMLKLKEYFSVLGVEMQM